MKFVEIQSHKASNKINRSFTTEWSEDDVIATTTDKGIEIMEVLFKPTNKTATVDCHRYHVNKNDSHPTCDLGLDATKIFMNAENDDAVKLLYNHDLGPKLNKVSSLQSVLKQIQWSPSNGVLSCSRCILAYLTNTGLISLVGFKYTKWCEVLNLSDQWVKYNRASWSSVISKSYTHQISELTYRAGRIKFTAFTWIKGLANSNTNESILITASQDGIITMWKIADGSDITNENDIASVQATVLISFMSSLTHISYMCWHSVDLESGYLIVGNIEGLVKYYKKINVFDNSITFDDEYIWTDKDKIMIMKILTYDYDDGIVCIIVKGSYLIVAYIKLENSNVKSLCFHDMQFQYISGIQKINKNSMLVSSRDNKFNLVDIVFEDDVNIVINKREIECGFARNRYNLYGFALSRNKVMGIAVLSITGAYDHLIIREPTDFVFYSLSELNQPLSRMISMQFGEINNVWDCFDVVRWQILNKIISYSLPVDLDIALDTMELQTLIITMWLTKFLINLAEREEAEDGKDGDVTNAKSKYMEEKFKEIEELVISANIFKRCAILLTKPTSFTEYSIESLSLMKNWLEHLNSSLSEKYVTTRSSAATLLEQMNERIKTNNLVLKTNEKCRMCNDVVPCLTGHKFSKCVRGHQVLRCSLSLVQITFDRYYRCTRCNAVANELAVLGGENECIFCKNYLRMDGRILDAAYTEDLEINEEDLKKEIDDLFINKVPANNDVESSIIEPTIILEDYENEYEADISNQISLNSSQSSDAQQEPIVQDSSISDNEGSVSNMQV